jgi:hypothetical protein
MDPRAGISHPDPVNLSPDDRFTALATSSQKECSCYGELSSRPRDTHPVLRDHFPNLLRIFLKTSLERVSLSTAVDCRQNPTAKY